MDHNFDPERLRPPEFICQPDPRSTMWVRIDRTDGSARPLELRDHYDEISRLSLNTNAPEEILLQFETARNVYLYAWLVYRFYPVAEQQSFACLELALRTRFAEDIRNGKIPYRGKQPTLRTLFKYAVTAGIVKNEGFERWRHRGEINARARAEMQTIRQMSENNLTETVVDYSHIEVTAEDLQWDYVNVLVEVLPAIRNRYAHGSTDLHAMALETIRIVCEIINQLYADPS